MLLVILVPAWWAAFVGSMRVVAVITEPPQVRKILRHLIKIGKAPPGLAPDSASLPPLQACNNASEMFVDAIRKHSPDVVGYSGLPTTTLGGAHVEQGGFDFHAALRSGKAAPEQAADLDRIIAEGEKHKKKLGFIRSYWG